MACDEGSYCPPGASAALPCPATRYSSRTDNAAGTDCDLCPPGACDDDNECTVDSCDPETGCTATLVPEGVTYLGVCWLLYDGAVDDEAHCSAKCAAAGMTCTSENLSLIDSCEHLKTLSSLLGVGVNGCGPGYNTAGSPMVYNDPGVNPNNGQSLNVGYYHMKDNAPSYCHDPPFPWSYFKSTGPYGWKHLCGCE